MALIGENGYVAISNIERTLGLTPATGMVRVVEALSCALDLNKAHTPSAALSAGRGVRNSVVTATTQRAACRVKACRYHLWAFNFMLRLVK